jgi:DNA-binding NarL/FixJ family response regulator
VASGCTSVLVVDDDESLRALMTQLLGRGGYRVREAATGDEALAAAREERPSLALVDVHLPGMSGYDVCRALRAEFGQGLPIVFISGERTEPFDRVAGLRLGADDYVVKPFDPDELLARIDRLVDRSRFGPEHDAMSSSRLTRRELEVLHLLSRGRTPKEIGRELSVSRKTVSTHIQNIRTKLNVHSQAQAVAVAFRDQLVEMPPTGSVPTAR